MHQYFVQDPDMENIILDSTVVRAHPCAAGARKKEGGQAAQALERSRGGFSTKIHVNVDASGNPLRFLLTAGQRHDITHADALIADYEFKRLIADTSYDTDDFRQVLADKPTEAVIPPRKNRKEPATMIIISTKSAIWWSASSIRSSSIGVSFPALTNLRSGTWAF